MERWRQDGGRGSRVVLADPAFAGDRSGHHWRLNTGYADRIGPERCWFAVHRSLRRARDVPRDRLIRAFAVSFYEAGELSRLGRLGLAVQTLAYRDVAPLPHGARRLMQGLLRRRRAGSDRPVEPRLPAQAPPLYAGELAELIDARRLGPVDHLVFPSLDAEMGRALLDLIAVRGAGALPALHLRLMYDDATRTASALDYQGLVERLAATGLVGGRVTLHCETPSHARKLAERLGVEVGVAPFPASSLPAPEGILERPLTIGFLGEARAEKGFELIEPVAEAFTARHPDLSARVRWRVHAGGETVEATAARDAVRGREPPDGIDLRYRFGALSPDAYDRMRAETDIVLAPQDARVYAERGSGVAQEAVAGGRPLVCLSGSSLAEEPGAAVAAAATVEGLADALAEIVRDPEPWFARARRGAEAFSDRLSRSSLVAACARPAPPGDRPVALVVGPWWPEGGSGRLMALQSETLARLGFQVARVHLARRGQTANGALAAALRGPNRDRHAVVSFAVDPIARAGAEADWAPADARLDALCRSGRVRLVVAHFAQTARWALRLPLGEGVKRIVETHELGLDPATGDTLARPAPPPPGQDAAVFVNAEELEAWASAGQANARLIIPPLDDRGPSDAAPAPTRDLLFVGSRHERNRKALLRLLDEVLAHPEMRDVSLLIAGDVAEPGEIARPNTTVLGHVQDLETAYGAARLVAAPHAPGGGLPSKVMGALARGRPLVADAGAVSFLDDPSPFAARDAADFRSRVRRALGDDRHREALAAASRRAWAHLAEPGRYERQWRDLLDALGALPEVVSRDAPNAAKTDPP